MTLEAGVELGKNGEEKITASCVWRFLTSLAAKWPAVIGLAEAGRPGVVLGTEPAIGAGQRRIAAASLKMIDADIAGNAGAQRILALDAAT